MDDWKTAPPQEGMNSGFVPAVDPTPAAEPVPVPYFIPYYIGHHETKRALPLTEAVLAQSAQAGYDMITSPITNSHFHSRVLALLSTHLNTPSFTPLTLPAPIIPPFDAVDTPLTPGDIASQLVCHTAPWIDLTSPDPIVASISRQVLTMEVAYAAFCGIQNIIIPGPRQYNSSAAAADGVTRYARTVQEVLSVAGFVQIAITLPMYSEGQEPHLRPLVGDLEPFCRPEFKSEEGEEQHELSGTWDAWNAIRSMCKYNPRLSIALEIPRQLPTQSLLDRWFCEPLKILSFAPKSFLRNKAGHPVLGKAHQALLTRYMRLKNAPWLLLCDVGPLPQLPQSTQNTATFGSSPMAAPLSSQYSELPHRGKAKEPAQPSLKDQTAHLIYLRHLQQHQPPQSELERFGSGYQDYLQSPLQPLTDNLESVTYEVFEKDPVKYKQYEKAITLALADWAELEKPTSGMEGKVVVVVAGPGRGPLVTRALRASQTTGVPIEIYAVEKNPNAYVLLQRHNETDELWGGKVHVVKSDMRAWRGPLLSHPTSTSSSPAIHNHDEVYGKVDIIISELLGSFGDNELSPECLDGVQHVLAPSGISIPANYTSHVSPIAAPRLHADILARSSDPESSNTPYVCMLHAIDFLSKYEVGRLSGQGVIKETWEFRHPLPKEVLSVAEARRQGGVSGGGGGSMAGSDGANEHNSRYSRTTFSIRDRGVMNGIAGYFESILYDGRRSIPSSSSSSISSPEIVGEIVEMSIRPDTIETKSKDMISWFPIFFPLKTPLYVPDDAEVDVSMWRQTDDRKVWYEWQVEVFVVVGDGRRLRVGSSEVSSSRNKGCLM